MRWRLTTVRALVSLVIVVGLFGALPLWRAGKVGFVAEVSGLPLPRHSWELAAHDSGDDVLIHMTLSREEQQAVLRAGKFHGLDYCGRFVQPLVPADFSSIGQLPPNLRQARAGAALHHAGGCSGEETWTALLDRTSGSLWVEVRYPGMGGFKPPCTFPQEELFAAIANGR